MDNVEQHTERLHSPELERSGDAPESVDANAIQTVDPRSFAPPKKTLLEKAKSLVDPAKAVGDVKDYKEQHAIAIALIITWTFAVSACLILIGIYLVLKRSPEDAKSLLASAAPMLKEAGTFLSSVFGPLLAFVLGYYFGEKKAKS